jgi:predicted enzyme related to lactoylglutathione lyase
MEKTKYQPGQFCWVDLQTSDTGGAKDFYGKIFGWDSQDLPTENESDYTLFLYRGLPAAGMSPQSAQQKEAGAPPSWSSYVCVENAEPILSKASSLGAKILMPVMKVMDQGFMAIVEDPTGATFRLWQPAKHIGAGWVTDVGGFCWTELYTRNVERATEFYQKLFGWEFQHSRPGGREYWTIKQNGSPNAGMMEIGPDWGEVPPSWSVYFTVKSCQASVEEAESIGAKVYLDPMEVPEVGTFAGLQDPQGAHFLIIEMKKG